MADTRITISIVLRNNDGEFSVSAAREGATYSTLRGDMVDAPDLIVRTLAPIIDRAILEIA